MKRIFNILALIVVSTAVSSCFKDVDIPLDPSKTQNVVEFKNPSDIVSPPGSPYALYSNSFEIEPESTFPIAVSYSGANTADRDIVVKLGVNAAAVDAYNDDQDTDYEALPTELYSMPAEVTIPKGSRTASVTIKLKTAQFDFSKNYVLPVQITSASHGVVSGNFSTILLGVGAKNKYDGVYRSTGTFEPLTTAGATAVYPKTIELRTLASNSVSFFDQDYGLNGYIFKTATGGLSYYGNFCPIFIMDDNGNVTAVSNTYGQGNNSSNRLGELSPDGINKFTVTSADDKTLEVSYVLRTTAGVVQARFTEKYEYVRSR